MATDEGPPGARRRDPDVFDYSDESFGRYSYGEGRLGEDEYDPVRFSAPSVILIRAWQCGGLAQKWWFGVILLHICRVWFVVFGNSREFGVFGSLYWVARLRSSDLRPLLRRWNCHQCPVLFLHKLRRVL
jgi:hypothetical protein